MSSPRPLRVPASWVRGAIGVMVLFLALELLTRAELVTPEYLPPASEILVETMSLFGRSVFWNALWATMKACLIGLGLATLLAVPLGLVLGLSKWAHKAAITIVELLRPIPSVALIPLAILVYGRGTEMRVSLVLYACTWPILFNTIYGMHNVDTIGADTARVFGMGRVKTVLRVYLPAASPFIFTGVRIAASVALILAVSTEIVAGGANGLGIELQLARELGDLKLSYAFTIVTGLVGLAMHFCFVAIERRKFAWVTGHTVGPRTLRAAETVRAEMQ
jgi:NitT/TauT family transport system permease protein